MVKWLVLGALALSVAGCGGIEGLLGVSVNIQATPQTVPNGTSVTLAWQSLNASSVVSSNFGAGSTSGTKVVTPGATTTYTITVQDSTGNQATNQVTVTVN